MDVIGSDKGFSPVGSTGPRRLYFAYGSNLHKAQMRDRCRDAVPVTTARLPDWRLVFRGRAGKTGVASIEPCPGAHVMGALWELSDADVASLDRYEGYPGFYGRKRVEVQTQQGPVVALVYLLQPGYGPAMPHPEYFEVILRGYRDWGLDPAPLEEARRRTAAEISPDPSPAG